jgi:hypothetical protein
VAFAVRIVAGNDDELPRNAGFFERFTELFGYCIGVIVRMDRAGKAADSSGCSHTRHDYSTANGVDADDVICGGPESCGNGQFEADIPCRRRVVQWCTGFLGLASGPHGNAEGAMARRRHHDRHRQRACRHVFRGIPAGLYCGSTESSLQGIPAAC